MALTLSLTTALSVDFQGECWCSRETARTGLLKSVGGVREEYEGYEGKTSYPLFVPGMGENRGWGMLKKELFACCYLGFDLYNNFITYAFNLLKIDH